MIKNRRLIFLSISVFALCMVFCFRYCKKTGLYSYSKGNLLGFAIGQSKEDVLDRILLFKDDPFFQVKTRQPYIVLDRYLIKNKKNTEKLFQSDYWIFGPNWPDLHLFIFNDGKLFRILEYHRLFGELNGIHPYFSSQAGQKDMFKKLSHQEIDKLIIETSNTSVYFDSKTSPLKN